MNSSPHLKAFREALLSPIVPLIERGNIIEVTQGKLVILPKSGRLVPKDWFKQNEKKLLADIAYITDRHAFMYHGYSLGKYGAHKHETLTLQFSEFKNMSDAYAAFNVSLKRQRASRNNEPKGSPLPKGEFSPPKAGEFVKLWMRTGLRNYNPSRLCRYMGNLKGLTYTGEYSITSNAKKKLANKSIDLLNITYDELIAAMPSGCLNNAQEMPNPCLRSMPKQFVESHVSQGLHEYPSTGELDHGLRLQGNAVNGPTHIATGNQDKSTTNSVDSWLDEYEKADGLSSI